MLPLIFTLFAAIIFFSLPLFDSFDYLMPPPLRHASRFTLPRYFHTLMLPLFH